ncbi:hypothetical protein OIU84_017421 [Salix udensis]|uniref:GCK domain-containing protein n=1 Tax=Salix udensis TaxID=889485 RepID=A0AAD6L1U5_9ROSI|nr:hypothetical protein OIU84_017421 [Salix udensis]
MILINPTHRQAHQFLAIPRITIHPQPHQTLHCLQIFQLLLKPLKHQINQRNPIDANGDEGQEVDVDEEEEEEGECGFCVYMKGGGCKDAFIGWEDCVKEAEDSNEDIVEKCREVTRSLTKCMEAHADYYEPILKAEKAAKEEAVNELKVKAAKESESNVAEKEAVIVVDLTDQGSNEGLW